MKDFKRDHEIADVETHLDYFKASDMTSFAEPNVKTDVAVPPQTNARPKLLTVKILPLQLNLRQEPSKESKVKKVYKVGATLKVWPDLIDGAWYKVKAPDEGYIMAEFVERV